MGKIYNKIIVIFQNKLHVEFAKSANLNTVIFSQSCIC